MQNYLSCIITHGSLASSLKAVAGKLVSIPTELFCYSNQESSLDVIEESIHTLIAEKKPDKILLFVDLMGGSCWISANRIKRQDENITVISGVSVPMLISYFINYERLQWNELIEKIKADALKGVVVK